MIVLEEIATGWNARAAGDGPPDLGLWPCERRLVGHHHAPHADPRVDWTKTSIRMNHASLPDGS
jgi:hypothetical protein